MRFYLDPDRKSSGVYIMDDEEQTAIFYNNEIDKFLLSNWLPPMVIEHLEIIEPNEVVNKFPRLNFNRVWKAFDELKALDELT